ncbi:ribosomal RNA small subunit methyltransferase A [Amygdalobacter nucleatus]|uniref:rRNA adenine N-6-methyltransferase n=1 Tax=Amygdalobacter nucleatus TaxID=3029274 RepID=A0A133YGS4_9FIRM|nr:rRNA adenine dimethyltransferase family protein [Amygdalobacter nucleatus]KXB42392.1 ribosomal RNA adenine dimethylase family protein [Amygdalobacter nucleatus]MDF0485968.1 rRNA adenine dimethyltransferase family protein [Amygdalobacter nucleatus]
MALDNTQESGFDPGYVANLEHKFKKAWGQNFLRYQKDAISLLKSIDLEENTLVIEVGAGGGALTEALLRRHFRVLAFEIDLSLRDFLNERFSKQLETGELHLLCEDALQIDWRSLFKSELNLAVISNLPYSETRELILKIYAEVGEKLEVLALMLQTEAISRLTAASSKQSNYQAKLYGPQAVFTQLLFAKACSQKISASAFYPVPKVNNSFVTLVRDKGKFAKCSSLLAQAKLDLADFFPYFADFLQLVFKQRRKQLLNSAFSSDEQQAALAFFRELELKASVRAEELEPLELFQLAIAMYNKENKKSD